MKYSIFQAFNDTFVNFLTVHKKSYGPFQKSLFKYQSLTNERYVPFRIKALFQRISA